MQCWHRQAEAQRDVMHKSRDETGASPDAYSEQVGCVRFSDTCQSDNHAAVARNKWTERLRLHWASFKLLARDALPEVASGSYASLHD